jgi:nitrate reductase beta subunit
MKIRAQIGMVLNLDKCIGCHTCSVTCKNVWTSREGVEYAWFNNVETKPGIGYPKEWENQDKWNGGWVRKANGRSSRRAWAEVAMLASSPTPTCRRSTTTTSRSPSTTSTCSRRPR